MYIHLLSNIHISNLYSLKIAIISKCRYGDHGNIPDHINAKYEVNVIALFLILQYLVLTTMQQSDKSISAVEYFGFSANYVYIYIYIILHSAAMYYGHITTEMVILSLLYL